MDGEYVEIAFDRVLHTTAQAVLLLVEETEIWVPLSVIEGGEVDEDSGVASVAEWFAVKEELV